MSWAALNLAELHVFILSSLIKFKIKIKFNKALTKFNQALQGLPIIVSNIIVNGYTTTKILKSDDLDIYSKTLLILYLIDLFTP